MSEGQQGNTRPSADPWQQWLHNLRSGNFHTNNGGQAHTNNGGQATQPTAAPNSSEKSFDDIGKKSVFSEKVAMTPENRYDGEHKGAQWRLNVRPYLISRAREREAKPWNGERNRIAH